MVFIKSFEQSKQLPCISHVLEHALELLGELVVAVLGGVHAEPGEVLDHLAELVSSLGLVQQTYGLIERHRHLIF